MFGIEIVNFVPCFNSDCISIVPPSVVIVSLVIYMPMPDPVDAFAPR